MVRIALGIEYDGSGFAGWQSQTHGNTVQDVLEKAMAAIGGQAVRVVCAGRTDAGVHATAQVVHFDTAAQRPASAWVRGVNAHLPPQVAVCWAREVGPEFHARFSAVARAYRYLLLNRPVRPALLNGRVGWFHHPLDIDAMRSAAACLIGEHDFSAFRAAECQAKSPVKHLYRADISTQNDCVVFDFRANAFLHHMIRNLVGSLVYIGKGKHPPAWMGELLAGRDRTRAAPTFAAAGLYFAGVEYDPVWQLPAGSPGFGHTILPPGTLSRAS
ncbi:MAG: tRNA pseudouridine(38-40) synthase TruA [Rhodocyclales bacterium GWA2_65_20]|nr:MAG: tRNA pseudouridine(38-40) synthase TruA [Rhodocyclales bacterium GWA2_65_20]